jgi:ATP-dependent Clp protease protease subunit
MKMLPEETYRFNNESKMMNPNEFQKYAVKHAGLSSMTLHRYQTATNGYISPTIIEERQLNVASMDVFSRLMMDRIIFLGAAIDDDVANILQAQLLFLDSSDPGKDIQIYLNSPGGVVQSGLGIYDTMQWVTSDVATICTGMAASMASVILAAGAKGKRSALKHSRVMIHQPSGGMQGQSIDMEITLKEILKLKEELYTILSDHTGKPYETIEKDSDRDYWMTAQEAKDYGLLDEVLTRHKK